MFKEYKVGNIYPEAIGHNDGCCFDISDAGADLIIYLDRPTQKELENFKSETPFEIRLLELSDIMLFLVKFGSLNWMDAPYTPHLSKNLTELTLDVGKGLAVTIMLFDSSCGRLESIRLVSLSETFTEKIKKNIDSLMKNRSMHHFITIQ